MKSNALKTIIAMGLGLILSLSSGVAEDYPPFDAVSMTLTVPKAGLGGVIVGDPGAGDSLVYRITGQIFSPVRSLPLLRTDASATSNPWQVIAASLAAARAGDIEATLTYYTADSVATIRGFLADPTMKTNWLASMAKVASANAIVGVVQDPSPDHLEIVALVQVADSDGVVGVMPYRVVKAGSVYRIKVSGIKEPMLINLRSYLNLNDVSQIEIKP